ALEKVDALPKKKDEDALRSDLESQIGAKELKKIDKEYIRLYVERKALNDAYTKWAATQAAKDQKPYTPAEREQQKQAYFQQYYANNPLCLNAIQTSTEEEAKAARDRIDAGDDFVTVAKSYVPDGATLPEGGSIACLTLDQAQQVIGTDVSDAKVGDLFGPVAYTQAQGSQPIYLVLRVEKTDGYTYEEAEPLIDPQVPSEPDAVDPASFDASGSLDKLLERASIQVNPLFGRWSAAARSVVPPRVPGAASTTTAPVAALPGS
ncbi:MAG: peptidylprolyl isomerase, partial [Aquihabitans sp.]